MHVGRIGPAPFLLPSWGQLGAGPPLWSFFFTIALRAGVAYVVVRCEPKEDRAGEREKRLVARYLIVPVKPLCTKLFSAREGLLHDFTGKFIQRNIRSQRSKKAKLLNIGGFRLRPIRDGRQHA
jgi:hypothetical protein